MDDPDMFPPDAPECPHCGFWRMVPWRAWWECPRCDGVMLLMSEV